MNLAFIDGSSPNFRMTSENNAYQAFASMVFKTKSYFEPNTHDQSSYPYVPQPPLPKNIYPAAYPAPTQHFTRPAPSLMQRPMTPQGFSSARVSENKNGLFNSSLQKAHSYTNTQARRHPRSSQSVPRPNQSQQPVQIHILQKNKTRA